MPLFTPPPGPFTSGAVLLGSANPFIITESVDADGTYTLGRAKIGSIGVADWATFSHFDRANSTDFGVLQQTDGSTYVNAKSTSATLLSFAIDATARWRLNSNGHFVAHVDNTYDIGATGATRPRTVHVGTSVVLGSATLTDGTSALLGVGGVLLGNSALGIRTAGGDWNILSDGAGALTMMGTVSIDLSRNGTSRFKTDGTGIGFFAATPVAKQASGANLTNNVTSGGTDDTIANYTDLTTYANDSAAIRNNIYQLARKLKQVNDGLRSYGLLT